MILKDERETSTSQNEVSINPNALNELGKLAEQFPEIGIDNIRHIFGGRIKLINIANDEIDLQKVGAGLHHIFGIKNGYGRIVPGSIQTHRYGIYSAELSIAVMVDGVVSFIPKCDSDINMIRSTFFPDILTPFQILSEIQNALNAIKKYFVGDEPVTKLINLENESSIQEDLKIKERELSFIDLEKIFLMM